MVKSQVFQTLDLIAFSCGTSKSSDISQVRKILLVEQDVNKDELRDRESEDSSEEFTGDGTVDRKGNIAKRQKTGGWRAAPLIFGMLWTSISSGQGLRFSQCRNIPFRL